MNEVTGFRMRKWDGSPHWVHPSLVLGDDDCGRWLGQRHEWVSRRPGGEFRPDPASVTVLPRGDSAWIATFFPPAPDRVEIYVDIVADLDVDALTAIDMDLDVVRQGSRIWIADEDEFEEHGNRMHYTDELVARCRAAAEAVVGLITAHAPPFDGRATGWLARLEASTPL